MEFRFGNDNDRCEDIKARTMKYAIIIFKNTVLYREWYIDEKFYVDMDHMSSWIPKYRKKMKEKAKGGIAFKRPSDSYSADEDGNRNYVVCSPDKAYISIFIKLDENRYFDDKPIGKLYFKDIDKGDGDANQKLLGTERKLDEEEKKIDFDNLVIIKDSEVALQKIPRSEIETMHSKLEMMKNKLEMQKQELQESLQVLKNELEKRMEAIWTIDLYLGTNEEVHRIREGKDAAESEKIAIRQIVFYMDEEVGIVEDHGIDFKKIDMFDKWIVKEKNLKRILPYPKGIAVFRVRRKDIKYTDDAWVNFFMNQNNHFTYFLIRNGDNVYRIWADIIIYKRLFPKKDEFEKMRKKTDSYWNAKGKRIERIIDRDEDDFKEKAEEAYKEYARGLLVIQGLVDRTPIFGTKLKGNVNIIMGYNTDKYFNMIRDDEDNLLRDMRRPLFHDYQEANAATIKVGTKIVFCKFSNHSRSSWDGKTHYSDLSQRTRPFLTDEYPKRGDHIVNKIDKNDSICILYMPTSDSGKRDTIWGSFYSNDDHERKNKVTFRMDRSEVFNIDRINPDDLDYYLEDRIDREHYAYILPFLKAMKKFIIEEREKEKPFIELVVNNFKEKDRDFVKEEIYEIVTWWKMKNKYKRSIETDDAKAYRMICRKLEKKLEEKAQKDLLIKRDKKSQKKGGNKK